MSSTTVHLIDRNPRVSPDELVAGLVPPPQFENVSFDSYRPDPTQPSQSAARDKLSDFTGAGAKRPGLLGRLFGGKKAPAVRGVYLDGGYGVGKTHLLASAWHANDKPAAFGTFVEYTNLIGALGFQQAKTVLSGMRLVCIDEFELDDPGDTMMMTRLMREIADAGVKIIATSNTLPGALGEGRFAAQDFLREIQAMADQFEILSIDGDDYRHRGAPTPPEPLDAQGLSDYVGTVDGEVAVDDFEALLEHLRQVHPSRYGRMLGTVTAAAWSNVATIPSQDVALRFVALVDRMYDRAVEIKNTGARLDAVFTPEMLAGGYKKKYLRCLSRLTALANAES
ncbi:cell division protein ZapE [Brevibacterium sp. 50QC2O2]|uniref:cell division protein ZapE n=1 Tax=Brevibacterium TaxID=1696 RepID=UPI00211C9BE8|nr:cell division protein ZapE [Brevibacterium sp. 91QC2O2]MCQ9384074.1 cell division protein ZapE [Brevibacterium sp. 68QC2CO]MCQ9388448.1 cell division protein ZapE [Brevibacterium sp. 50QC2O2]